MEYVQDVIAKLVENVEINVVQLCVLLHRQRMRELSSKRLRRGVKLVWCFANVFVLFAT